MNTEKENKKFTADQIKLRNNLFSNAISGLLANGHDNNEQLYNKAFEIAVKGVVYLKSGSSKSFLDKFNSFTFKI